MTEQLKPCPMCGEHEGITIGETRAGGMVWWGVKCRGCCVWQAGLPTREAALAAWNTRPDTAKKAEKLLREILAAQTVAPYSGWNVTALNRAADKARELFGMPSIRSLNPDIDRMLTAVEANGGPRSLQNIRRNLEGEAK